MKFILFSLLAITGFVRSCGKPSVHAINSAREVTKNIESEMNSDNISLELLRADSICDKYLNEMSKENKYISYDNSDNTITITNID